MQPNKVNVNEMDYGRWNEWVGLWTEGNIMKHDQWSVDLRKWDETWLMKCGLKEVRWNMNNEVWTEGNKWSMKNEVDNVTSPSLSLTTTLQASQK